MNREEILSLAEEAGFNVSEYTGGRHEGKVSIFDYAQVDIFTNVERFAELVAAAVRARGNE